MRSSVWLSGNTEGVFEGNLTDGEDAERFTLTGSKTIFNYGGIMGTDERNNNDAEALFATRRKQQAEMNAERERLEELERQRNEMQETIKKLEILKEAQKSSPEEAVTASSAQEGPKAGAGSVKPEPENMKAEGGSGVLNLSKKQLMYGGIGLGAVLVIVLIVILVKMASGSGKEYFTDTEWVRCYDSYGENFEYTYSFLCPKELEESPDELVTGSYSYYDKESQDTLILLMSVGTPEEMESSGYEKEKLADQLSEEIGIEFSQEDYDDDIICLYTKDILEPEDTESIYGEIFVYFGEKKDLTVVAEFSVASFDDKISYEKEGLGKLFRKIFDSIKTEDSVG